MTEGVRHSLSLRGTHDPSAAGCHYCVAIQPRPEDRTCDHFLGYSSPCGWRGSWGRERVYRALALYQEHGQLAADAGSIEAVLADEEPDREERSRLRRVVAAIHRAVRAADAPEG